MPEHVGFIGLGSLGLPMATNLLATYALTVSNRTASKADPLVARGATFEADPAKLGAPIVVTSLWDGPVVLEACTPAFLASLRGGLHISTTTLLPETSKQLAAAHAAAGVGFVEAPIFGRPEAAVARQLAVPYVGSAADKARAKPVLEAMGTAHLLDLGEAFGAALATKLAGNFMMFAAARTFEEALAMAKHAGADPAKVVDMLTSTLFAAPVYKSHGQRLVEGQPALVSKIPAKDLGLFVETAGDVPTPIAAMFRSLIA